MPKLSLENLTSQYASVSQLNANFQAIEDYINQEALSRANSAGEDNFMDSDLDMNSYRILNLPEPLSSNEPVRLVDLNEAIFEGVDGLVPIEQPRQLGDGVTTTFSTPATGSVPAALLHVRLNGSVMRANTEFTYNPSTGDITFVDGAPNLNAEIDVTYFKPAFISTAYSTTADLTHKGNSLETEVDARVPTIASLGDLQASSFDSGIGVKTRGYTAAGDGGHAVYYIKTAAQAATDGDVVDEVLNHTIANGNIAVLQDRIGVDVTLNVPGDYTTIADAIARLRPLRITGATVTVQVADGSYSWSETTLMNHQDGANIHILGNVTTPSNVTITYPNAWANQDAFVVSNGHSIGLIDGFKFNKAAKANNTDIGTALLAVNGATIVTGGNIEIDNFYYGAAARVGSTGIFDDITVTNSGDVGIWAFVGSTVSARNATSNNAIDGASLGFGLQAEYGSAMDCEGASATGCQVAGIAALSNSNVRAKNCTSSSNTGSGLFARDGATIEAHDATSSNNTNYGIEEIANGRVFGTGITATGNTVGNYNPRAQFDNGTGNGARVVASDGALRLDNNGTDPIQINTAGGLQFEVLHTASAVNYVAATGAATGLPARVLSAGSDTDIDLHLQPKGAGQLRWGVHTAGTPTANGYVEWKLDDGATVRVAAERI